VEKIVRIVLIGDDEDLRYLSPLLRHHIGIYGQYNFDFRRFEAAPPVESLTY
jgi:hypothetical protein